MHCKDEDWLEEVLVGLRHVGFAVVDGVADSELVVESRAAMFRAQATIDEEIGADRTMQAGELPGMMLRLLFQTEPIFLEFLALPEVLAVIDATVGDAAILHQQNGVALGPAGSEAPTETFQNRFHQDFRTIPGMVASVCMFFALDAFSPQNGSTLLVPGSHQQLEAPDHALMERNKFAVNCPAGSMIVFDSTIWHASGANRSPSWRLGLNNQFTRSYFKQQIDYVRALGDDRIQELPERTKQLLGWYTRIPTSRDEYYRPAAERLYRGGQG